MTSRRICVGQIAKPVGIRGQVKVHSYMSSPSDILNFPLFLENGSRVVLKNVRVNENSEIVACIDGCATRNDVEKYRLQNIYVNRSDLPETEGSEFYYEDLVGCCVKDQDNQELGKIRGVFDYGAGTFLEIKLTSNKLATLPFSKDSVSRVDLEAKEVFINRWMLLI